MKIFNYYQTTIEREETLSRASAIAAAANDRSEEK